MTEPVGVGPLRAGATLAEMTTPELLAGERGGRGRGHSDACRRSIRSGYRCWGYRRLIGYSVKIARLVGRAGDVDLVVGVGGDDIELTVVVEVAHGQGPGLLGRREFTGGALREGAEGAVADAEGELDRVEVGGHTDDIENAIAVEVAGGDGIREVERWTFHTGCKGIVAGAGKEVDVVGGGVADDDVQLAVAVEVAHDQGGRIRVRGSDERGAEGAIAGIREDFEFRSAVAGNSDRRETVMLKVANGNAVGIGAGGERCRLQGEGSGAEPNRMETVLAP